MPAKRRCRRRGTTGFPIVKTAGTSRRLEVVVVDERDARSGCVRLETGGQLGELCLPSPVETADQTTDVLWNVRRTDAEGIQRKVLPELGEADDEVRRGAARCEVDAPGALPIHLPASSRAKVDAA